VIKKLYWMWRKGKIERRYIDVKKEFRKLIENV